jgi:hypothetical protein
LPINQKNKDKIVRFIGIEKYNLYYRRWF